MWNFIILIVIISVSFFLLEKLLRKKLHIPNKNRFIYKPVNAIHKWGEIIITIIYLIASFVLIATMNYINLGYFMFVFFIVLHMFRTFMEWKFDKESKEYVISFIGVICLTITCSVVMYLL